MPPKMPQIPQQDAPVIRSKAMIQAEQDARIKAAQKTAHKVLPAEQEKREDAAKATAKVQRKIERMSAKQLEKAADKILAKGVKAVDTTDPPKESKEKPLVRADFSTLSTTDTTRYATAETGSKLLAEVVNVLRDDSNMKSARFLTGCVLTLRDGSRVVGRKHFASPEAAEDHGEKVMATGLSRTAVCHECGGLGKTSKILTHNDGKPVFALCQKCCHGKVPAPSQNVDSYTVSDEIRRVDVLAGDKAPSSDPIIPSRKRGPICQVKNYDNGARWQKQNMGDSNVRSNMSPAGYSLGWSAKG